MLTKVLPDIQRHTKPPMPRNWSEAEIAAIVEDYFEMLALELEGRRYNKTEHRLALMDMVDRTKGSIERKHMNISAVLAVLGLPYIDGYKPYSNFQQALFEAVQARLHGDTVLYASLTGEAAAVREPLPKFRIDTEQVVDPEQVYVDAPLPPEVTDPKLPEDISRIIRKFEPPAERDARNRMLGKAGEEFVFELERKRLSMLGQTGPCRRCALGRPGRWGRLRLRHPVFPRNWCRLRGQPRALAGDQNDERSEDYPVLSLQGTN